jgi:hypothetical protein
LAEEELRSIFYKFKELNTEKFRKMLRKSLNEDFLDD